VSVEDTDETLVGHGPEVWEKKLSLVNRGMGVLGARESVESGIVIFAGSNAVIPPRSHHAAAGQRAGSAGGEELLDTPGTPGTFGRMDMRMGVGLGGAPRERERLRDNRI
jgi:hypothetical protein